MNTLLGDLRFAARMLARSPVTTLVALITLALAIGANSSVFSVVNAMLLRPLPYTDPGQLYFVLETQPEVERQSVPYFNYLDYQAEQTSFTEFGAMGLQVGVVTGQGDPQGVYIQTYSHNMLDIFGAQPILGRNFLPEEDAPHGARVAILQHAFWATRYGADPAIVGKTITLDGNDHTVVGVLPADFQTMYPGMVFVPLGSLASQPIFLDRAARPEIYPVGRLKPGVSEAEAAADLAAIGEGLAKRYPREVGSSRPLLLSVDEELVKDYRGSLMLLLGAVISVLLIAAANVANLMLERAITRQRELRIRAALGAGRWRLFRQLLVESTLLALLGAGLGLLLALWGVDLLDAVRPRSSTVIMRGEIGVDAAVLGYTLAIAVGTGLLFGLVPALFASRQDLAQAMKDTDHHASAGSTRMRARNLLVVGEVALALALLLGAALSIRDLQRAQAVDLGFDRDDLLFAVISEAPTPDRSPLKAMQFWDRVKHNIEAIPGVVSVGWSSAAPFLMDLIDQFQPLGAERTPDNMRAASTYLVGPGYIEALKIPLVAGRTFGPQDVAGTPPGVIIDTALAEAFFPGQDPVGQRLQDRLSGLPSVEIIGVVGHVQQYTLDQPEKTPYQMYYAFAQLPEESQRQVRLLLMGVYVRIEGDPVRYAEQLRDAVKAADPEQPGIVQDYSAVIAGLYANQRFTIKLLSVFAGVALVLAALGLYAVMGNAVAQRTRELGVRLALGAQPRAVVNLVVRQGMALVGVGVALGLLGGVGLVRLLSAMHPHQDAIDVPAFLAATLVIVVVGLTATYIPARRVTRIDPMIALRHE